MITTRSRAEELQRLHRFQGHKVTSNMVLNILSPRNSETSTGRVEKIGNEVYTIVGTYTISRSPKNHSLKRRSSSSEAPGSISYGFNRITLLKSK